MRSTTTKLRLVWTYAVDDGIVTLRGHVHESDALMEHDRLKTYAPAGRKHVGITMRRATEAEAIRAVRSAFSNRDFPLSVTYAGDAESDAADARAEARIP